MESCAFDVVRLRELYQPDPARMALARQRQTALWRGEKPDAWPAIISGALTSAQEVIPTANLKEAFESALLPSIGQALNPPEGFKSQQEALKYWYGLG